MGESDDWGTRLNAYLVALGAGGSNAALSHVRATKTSAQALTGTLTAIVYDIEEYDTLTEYSTSTGLFTATVDGYYAIEAQALVEGAPYTASHANNLAIYKNGVIYLTDIIYAQASLSMTLTSRLATTVHLSPGDTVGVRVSSNAAYTTSTAAYANFIAIDRYR